MALAIPSSMTLARWTALGVLALPPAHALAAGAQGCGYATDAAEIPGEFIVKWQSAVPKLAFAPGLPGAPVIEPLPFGSGDRALVRIEPTANPQARFAALKDANPGLWNVERIQPNYRWGFEREPADIEKPNAATSELQLIGAPAAWGRAKGEAVVVAVIDSGIFAHKDLASSLWLNPGEKTNGHDDDGNRIDDDIHGANFGSAIDTGDTGDTDSHGTHVAGTIATVSGRTNVAAGPARLMALKFTDTCSTASIVRAIQYAMDKGAAVINASWGGRQRDDALESKIAEAGRKGILFVAAAGSRQEGGGTNNDSVPLYPSSYPLDNIIAVQGSAIRDGADRWWASANYGKETVDIAAPGVYILSTCTPQYGGRCEKTGSSMAAAHVSGAAVLIKSLAPRWQYAEIKQQLLGSARKVDLFAKKSVSEGRLDLDAATQAPIEIRSPKANDAWTGKSAMTVAWVRKFSQPGCRKLDIAMAADAAAQYVPLVAGVDADQGQASVTVLDVESSGATLRVQCSGTQLNAYSQAFTIK